jgi:transposase-like protein
MKALSRPNWAGDFTMKRTRHTAEQIIRKLKTAEQLIAQGKTVADVCRVIEVTQPTFHRWWHAGRGGKAADAAGEGERPAQVSVQGSGRLTANSKPC